MLENALIIFTKNPELGKVKTRLAKTVGDEEALNIYWKLLEHTQGLIQNCHAEIKVYYHRYLIYEDGWGGTSKKVQSSGDLGEKMAAAFQAELENYDKVCIIGTDCAELTTAHIEKAFDKLNDHDFVIGPANDGGYYLLGMNQFAPELFEGVRWSTEQVYSQTVSRIASHNKTYFSLPELIDVDTIEDWEMVRGNFK